MQLDRSTRRQHPATTDYNLPQNTEELQMSGESKNETAAVVAKDGTDC